MTPTPQPAHRFTTSWRWPPDFESWVDALTHGRTANVCAGLSPLGDIRVDLMTPLEIMGLLQDDENTSLEDARAAYSDLLTDDFTGRDVIDDLYDAADPPTHEAAQYVTTDGHVRANVFDHTLPFPDAAFDTVIADPPWKELPERMRSRFFNELTRITAPGGRLIFNAWWIPTNDHVTLDAIRIQQDTNRYPMGTPCVSYVTVYTVHESKPIARYLSRTLVDHEYAPTPSDLKEAIEAETAYRLTRIEGVPHTHYEIDVVGPSPRKRCPHCGTRALDPASEASGHHVPTPGSLYVCPSCEYPVTDQELAAIANGDIHRVRYENDWTTVPPAALHAVDPTNPPDDLLNELASEPGLTHETAPVYLTYALTTHPNSVEQSANVSGLAAFLSSTAPSSPV